MFREGIFDHHRRDVIALLAAGGTPTAVSVLGPCPEGYAWYVENAAYNITGNNHTAQLDVAVLADNGALPAQATWDHAGMVWTNVAAIRGSVAPGVAWYCPAAHWLVAYAYGGSLAATDTGTVTFQIAVHELDVRLGIMSRQDEDQVRAAHERPGALLAANALGDRVV
jgi:hypothetical protein